MATHTHGHGAKGLAQTKKVNEKLAQAASWVSSTASLFVASLVASEGNDPP